MRLLGRALLGLFALLVAIPSGALFLGLTALFDPAVGQFTARIVWAGFWALAETLFALGDPEAVVEGYLIGLRSLVTSLLIAPPAFVGLAGEVVGTFQTALHTTLSGRGSSSLIVEAVQTREDMRGRGIGERMMRHAIAEARARGAKKVRLTSNAVRTDAHRFYERLGFVRTHFGFLMPLK